MLVNKKQLKVLINELEMTLELLKNGCHADVQLWITTECLDISKHNQTLLYNHLMNDYKRGKLNNEIKALKNNLDLIK